MLWIVSLKKICWSPKTQKLWMWPYLKIDLSGVNGLLSKSTLLRSAGYWTRTLSRSWSNSEISKSLLLLPEGHCPYCSDFLKNQCHSQGTLLGPYQYLWENMSVPLPLYCDIKIKRHRLWSESYQSLTMRSTGQQLCNPGHPPSLSWPSVCQFNLI